MITSLPQNQNADFILYLMSQDFSESQVIIVHFLLFKTIYSFCSLLVVVKYNMRL